MRIAVISDVHSNLHALQAVLGAIDADAVDEIWCLGDVVGYGPRPNECCTLVRERASLCLAGNHDLGVIGTLDLDFFAGDAGAAARWTRAVLAADARGFLAGLEPSGRAAVNPTGNPGLASGGTGDVLAGVAGALLARHPPWLAATAAAYVHGLAGDCAARRRGQESLLAGDLLESLPEAIGLLPTSGGPASAR